VDTGDQRLPGTEPGIDWEFFPGVPIRQLLAFTYAEVSRGKDESDQWKLDHWLGIGPDPSEQEKRERIKLLAQYGEVHRE
jgi:hypothetical protein